MLVAGIPCASMGGARRADGTERHGGNSVGFDDRMAQLGGEIGSREASHASQLDAAREKASELHARVAGALEQFHRACSEAGSPHLRIELGPPHLDAKHVRAIEFDLRRGRTRAIVVVKSRGEVTLVGPFAMGKSEGPCRSIAFDAEAEILEGLEDWMSRFLEEAVQP